MKKKKVLCMLLASQLLFTSLPVAAQQGVETQQVEEESTQTVEEESTQAEEEESAQAEEEESAQQVEEESAQTVEEESTQTVEEVTQESLENANAQKTISVGNCTLEGDAASGWTLTKYNGSGTTVDLTAPEFEGYKIIAIEAQVFWYEANITKVVLPDTIESIGQGAFYGCTALNSCNMPKNLKTIGREAFSHTAISKVSIPASCTSIGEGAFEYCKSLQTLIISEGITTLPKSICYGNTALTTVQLPTTCTSIGDYAFYGCTKLDTVNIPDACNSIGSYAFYNTGIKSVKIPATIKKLPEGVFKSCDYLEEVTFAQRTEEITIGEEAFYDCKALAGITLPKSCTAIEKSAFYGCSKLTSISIPEGVKGISESTFQNCSALSEVKLPESCTSIGSSAFSRCDALKELTIPSKCTSIGSSAFYSCDTLTKLTFLNGDTILTNGALDGLNKNKLVIESELGGNVEEYAKNNSIKIQCKSAAVRVTKLPDKTNYFYGEDLVLDGIVVSADCITQKGNKTTNIDVKECSISGFDSKKVGTQKVTLTYGGVSTSFAVNVFYDISKMNVTCYDTEYSGLDRTDFILSISNKSVKLVRGVDYVIEYTGDLINAGDKKVKIIGAGNYKGEKTVEFKITPKNLNNIADLSVLVGDVEYTGAECIPAITMSYGSITLTPEDYSVQCSNNINAGTAEVKIVGKNNYTGTLDKTFKIYAKSIQNAVITLEKDIYAYDGTAKNPVITVTLDGKTLMKDVDYYVSYSNNIKAGNATVAVYGQGNYSGASSKDYKINVIPGTSHVVGSYKYKVLSDKEVSLTGMQNKTLKTVKVPASIKISGKTFKVTAIGDKAFNGAKATKITVGKNVTKIGKQAFRNTKKLKTLVINSKNIKSVGKDAFKGIYAKAKIKVPKEKYSAYKKLFKNKGQGKQVKITK